MAAGLGDQDLRGALKTVTRQASGLTGPAYGAFFYNVEDDQGRRLDLYALAGAGPADFPDEVPVRHTAVFAPTFSDREPVRIDDLLSDPRYGRNAATHWRAVRARRRPQLPCRSGGHDYRHRLGGPPVRAR